MVPSWAWWTELRVQEGVKLGALDGVVLDVLDGDELGELGGTGGTWRMA